MGCMHRGWREVVLTLVMLLLLLFLLLRSGLISTMYITPPRDKIAQAEAARQRTHDAVSPCLWFSFPPPSQMQRLAYMVAVWCNCYSLFLVLYCQTSATSPFCT